MKSLKTKKLGKPVYPEIVVSDALNALASDLEHRAMASYRDGYWAGLPQHQPILPWVVPTSVSHPIFHIAYWQIAQEIRKASEAMRIEKCTELAAPYTKRRARYLAQKKKKPRPRRK